MGPDLPKPKWTNHEKLSALLYRLYTNYIDLFLKESSGRMFFNLINQLIKAWHMDRIISAMDNFVNNKTKHKMIIYSMVFDYYKLCFLAFNKYVNNKSILGFKYYKISRIW